MVSSPVNALKPITYVGHGITSRREIRIDIEPQAAGHGIKFALKDDSGELIIPALASSVVNTLRNVTLGAGTQRLCIVEHLLAATALWGLDDLLIRVDGPEIPLGDGSAKFWIDLFESNGWTRRPVAATQELTETLTCQQGDRVLMAIPAEEFSVSYLMDWNHPQIGKRWQTWTSSQDVREIADARTFGSMQEHKLLGIADQVVSMTPDGFSHPLRWEDEPVRHKILDLVGDLSLSGINPLSWKARFVSIKAGHMLDVELAKKLWSQLTRK